MTSNLMYRHGMKNHFGSFWCSFMYPRMQKKERRLSVQKLRIDREWFVSNFIDFLKQVNLPLSAIVSENQSLILILFPLNFYNQISIRDGHSTILNHFYVSQKLQMKEYVDFDLLFFIWIYNFASWCHIKSRTCNNDSIFLGNTDQSMHDRWKIIWNYFDYFSGLLGSRENSCHINLWILWYWFQRFSLVNANFLTWLQLLYHDLMI